MFCLLVEHTFCFILEDVEDFWLVAALRFDLTILTLPPSARYDLAFANHYVQELRFVTSIDAVELPLDALAQIKGAFPRCKKVELVLLFSAPSRRVLLTCCRLPEALQTLALDLKAENTSVSTLVDVLKCQFFDRHPDIEFIISIGYVKRTKWAAQIKEMVCAFDKLLLS